jgi:hypothetical protein
MMIANDMIVKPFNPRVRDHGNDYEVYLDDQKSAGCLPQTCRHDEFPLGHVGEQ